MVRTLLVGLILFLLPAPPAASRTQSVAAPTGSVWGTDGHQIVGMLAESLLQGDADKPVRQAIAKLLDDADLGDVANWADTIRKRRPKTSTWHFIDIPLGSKQDDLAELCTGTCIIAKIDEFKGVLRDPSVERAKRIEALKFLVHFIGDLHQPLHCAERPMANGDPDRGGNGVRVTVLGHSTNLHSAWDSAMLEAMMADEGFEQDLEAFTKKLKNEITQDKINAWSKGTTAEWAWESHVLAKKEAYKGVPKTNDAVELGDKYVANAQVVIREQLQKAGVRLATVLRETLKP